MTSDYEKLLKYFVWMETAKRFYEKLGFKTNGVPPRFHQGSEDSSASS